MNELRLLAPAKINWTLEVLGKRPDGYHEIDTVMQAIDLCDDFVFRELPQPEFRFRSLSEVPIPAESNLVHRAYSLLKDEIGSRGVEIELAKKIPIGAGLGGGSSDAAATLVGLNRLLDLGLSTPQLAQLAAQLGSDVAFFVYGGAARCRGRGENIEPLISGLPQLKLVIVFPGFTSSTADAYAALRSDDFSIENASERAANAMKEGALDALLHVRSNTFDRVLTKFDPRYGAVKTAMRDAGIVNPMLTGSGAACYGLASETLHLEKLRSIYPQSFIAEPFG